MEWGAELAVIATMVAINGVFAAYEIGLASVTLARLQLLASENRWGAKAAVYMKESMEASLAVVQLGITLVGVTAAATGGAGAEERISPHFQEQLGVSSATADALALGAVVIPLTLVTIVLGELVPKVFALRNQELVCLRLSPIMRWFTFSVWPIVWVLENSVIGILNLAERILRPHRDREHRAEAAHLQELRAGAALARASRLIGAREEKIIVNALKLSSRPVQEIMLPAEGISMLNINDNLATCLVSAHLDMHTRFPVTDRAGDAGAIIGYANFKDIVAQLRLAPQAPSLRSILRPIPSFLATSPIAQCMEAMIHSHTHIALVRDADGQVRGMITLEDIIEELVGEIYDEHDRLPMHAVVAQAGWVVGGGISMARLRELTGIDLAAGVEDPSVRSLNQWMAHHLGRPVQGGDEIEHLGLRILVRKIRRQQVLEAQVTRLQSVEPAPQAAKTSIATDGSRPL